ncbi:TRAP transporter small permease subunit [Pigmentiphaga sp.]|uniref:TRAP transporter small permease n=1 Tax=Pigmentiphaga sp. TaxID=1977564 RepID=UPI00128D94B8|nr:TRAP transporter small permease subunit [Pigmentiphaga sp.]
MIARVSAAYGRLLAALAAVGCALLLAMMLVIVADVLLRNLAIAGLPRGLAWSNEVSEAMLYLITLCLAPWLLRQGQHIRVDIVLQAIPRRLAWGLEWLSDVLGLGCCLVIACYGAQSAWTSYQSGAMNIKTLVTPEWWMLAPLPVVFLLLAVEMLFRMHRLLHAEAGPRNEAVSAS